MKDNNANNGVLHLSKAIFYRRRILETGDSIHNHNLRWEESLRILGHERDQIINEYSSLSLRSNEERSYSIFLSDANTKVISGDADLSRIAEESRRAEELFEEKLMEARDSIARVFEEHRRMRREMVSVCIIYDFFLNCDCSWLGYSKCGVMKSGHDNQRRTCVADSIC